MSTVETNIKRGLDQRRAIRITLRKYKHYFEERVDENDTDAGEESDDAGDKQRVT